MRSLDLFPNVVGHGSEVVADPPVELWQLTGGASFLLVVAFIVYGMFRIRPIVANEPPESDQSPDGAQRRMPAVAWLVAGLGIAGYLLTLTSGLFGLDSARLTITPTMVFVIVWIAVPFLSVLGGDVWRLLNPFSTVGRLLPPKAQKALPAWAPMLAPALFGGFLFVYLIHPSGISPRVLGWAVVVYSVVVLGGLVTYGQAWVRKTDAFGILFGALGTIGPIGRSQAAGQGSVIPSPMRRLARLRLDRPAVLLVLLAISGIAFDGLISTTLWTDTFPREPGWQGVPELLVGLAFVLAVVTVVYNTACRLLDRDGSPESDPFVDYGTILVPILAGVLLGHYLPLLYEGVQTFWHQLPDPYGQRWELFGGAHRHDEQTLDATVAYWLQASLIGLGHLLALAVGHDRTLADSTDSITRLQSQYVVLLLVTASCAAALWLLLPGEAAEVDQASFVLEFVR